MIPARLADHDVRFQANLIENPEVYKILVEYSLKALRLGRKQFSIRWVWEEARAHNDKLGGLNDHFHSRYARLMMALVPELKGVFDTRRLRSRTKAA
jgi:hypothetical protein